MDIGHSSGDLYRVRIALGRLLTDFQHDLEALEASGLQQKECDLVKAFLAQLVQIFKDGGIPLPTVPTSVYSEIGKHFEKYAKLYSDWNGHEGADLGKAALRKKDLAELRERRRKLFHKLSQRQSELAGAPQLDMFVTSIGTPFATLADRLPERFPRIRQGLILFGR